MNQSDIGELLQKDYLSTGAIIWRSFMKGIFYTFGSIFAFMTAFLILYGILNSMGLGDIFYDVYMAITKSGKTCF